MWQQYAEGRKGELLNVGSRERSKSQPDNVVQLSNRQYQDKLAPYSPKLINDAQ